jgi:thiol-disulfide isomerase/thioredoxin
MELALYEGCKYSDSRKPLHITTTDWKISRIKNYGTLLEQYSQILIDAGQKPKALQAVAQSANLLGESTPNTLYDNLTDLAFELNTPDKAFDALSSAILFSNSTETLDKSYKDICTKMKLSGDYNLKIDSLKSLAKTKRIESLKYNQMSSAIENWSLNTIDGKQISKTNNDGKITVIAFWSTWCGPCRITTKAMETLFLKYKDDKNISIITVNVWENSKNRTEDVKNYIKEQDLSLPVCIDENDELPYKLGFTGLPTVMFIGKSGKLEYLESGLLTEEKFLQNVQDIIEILSKQ